jgi:enterochelin esterase family protein
MRRFTLVCAGILLIASVAAAQAPSFGFAQDGPEQAQRVEGPPANRPPTVVSPEVLSDRRVVFRIYAPKAQAVTLNAGDIPAASPTFAKLENGVWEATTAVVPPGAFRYVFVVDGVRTLDPVNTRLSESNTATWSMFDIPGLEAADLRDVPHGAVAEVFYASSVLKRTRRMHVYTPPGYESGSKKYPVFYLLHGSGDTDDAWTGVGRAGFILDNLIAGGKAVPMIVVMPAGHQPATTPAGGRGGAPGAAAGGAQAPPAINPFTLEFVNDIMPYVKERYRVQSDRDERAIAGLSMGGSQTLDIAFRHLSKFAYIGVFSSGASLGGGARAATPAAPGAPAPAAAPAPTAAAQPAAAAAATPPRPDWEAIHLADLDNPKLKKETLLIWLATGVDDRLMPNTKATVDLLKKHGFAPEFKESAGGHTWLNWRDYLIEFAPRLFK